MPKVIKKKPKKDDRKHVIFRLEDDDHALLKIAATAEGTSMGGFIKNLVMPSLEPYRAIQGTLQRRRNAASQ